MANLVASPPKGNILEFPARTGVRLPGIARQASHDNPWQALTRAMLLEKARIGQLEPELLAYILDAAGIGTEPNRPGSAA